MNASAQKSDLQQALKICQGAFMAAGGFSLIINLLMLTPTIYMLQLYDRVLNSRSIPTLLMLTLITVAIFMVQAGLEWVRTHILIRISARLELLLNQRLYKISFKQALYTGGQQASSQFLDDLTGLRQFLTGNGLFAFFDAPWLPFYLGVMFIFHPYYGYFGCVSAIVLIVLAVLNEQATSRLLGEAGLIAMNSRQLLDKNLRNAEVIESMGMLKNIQQRWLSSNYKVLALQTKASSRAGLLSILSKTFRILFQSLILGLGTYLAVKQEITPGLMIGGSILLGRALSPIDLMIGSWKGFILARGQYARLNKILLLIPDDQEKMPLPEPKGTIQLEQVVIIPPGSKIPVIKNISLLVHQGDSVGIIGASGAGKSTLLRGILGIWPAANGKVRLDGADIATWDRIDLGPHLGYLPQDIELFEGSIGENIARFGEVDAEQVVAAAELAGVHEMILRLPDGYDTFIGAAGGKLSGGQRQRIGLARALYGNPKVVVLDEPNSNLDDSGEMALSSAINRLKAKQVTVIIVTHRPAVLSNMDKLIVLKEGQIFFYGPCHEIHSQLQQPVKPVADSLVTP